MKLKYSNDSKLKHLIHKGRFHLGALFLMVVLIAPISFMQPTVAASPQAPYAPPGLSCVDFSSVAVGQSVEGLGKVHPDLAINTGSGSAIAVAEGVFPSAYGGPNGPNAIPNGGMGILQGFYDKSRAHDYVFTFSPDKIVNVFSIKTLDFGDLNAPNATEHEVSLVAYDSLGNVVDTHTLAFTSDGLGFPRSGSAGDLWITGDASAEEGQPGNFTFTVSGNEISRVEMHYNSNSSTPELPTDPYFGLTLLCFEEVVPPASLCADFAALEPNTSVEGLGTIHPDLEIRTSSGSAVAIHEGVTPGGFGGPNGDGSIPNVGMGALQGFFDKARVHDYVFTFGPNQSVSVFTLKMLDFGDHNEQLATEHEASLIAYNANGDIVDSQVLWFTSDGKGFPRSGSAGDLWITGDATAQEGEPGNYTFTMDAPGIVRVEMHYNSNGASPNLPTDPYFGLAVLCFEPETNVPELDPPTADLTLLRPKTAPEIGGKFLVEYACSETAPNLVSATINGYDVLSGQQLSLVVRERESARIVNDLLVWLFAPEFSLDVTCADDNGNEVSTSVMPEFDIP